MEHDAGIASSQSFLVIAGAPDGRGAAEAEGEAAVGAGEGGARADAGARLQLHGGAARQVRDVPQGSIPQGLHQEGHAADHG